jgi:uncharacterized damage-inducible protein DinB
MSPQDLIETCNINNRINLFLLNALPPEVLPSVPPAMKGRSVAAIFAHIHAVRLTWLDVIAQEQAKSLPKIPTRTKTDLAAITLPLLQDALEQSAAAMTQGITARLESGKTSVFKPNPIAFVGYLVGHEGYHRGEICMTLTEAGHKLPDDVLYGQWEWEKR